MASICNQCKNGYRLCHNGAINLQTPDGASLIIKNDVSHGNITVYLSDNINKPTELHTFMLIDPLLTGNSVTIIPPAGSTINGAASYVQVLPILVTTFSENSGNWLMIDEITKTVAGPGSSTDNAAVRWDGTTGNTFQDSIMIIDDSANVTGLLSTDIEYAGEYQKVGTRIFDIDPINNTLVVGKSTGSPVGTNVIIAGASAASSITTGYNDILLGKNTSSTITTAANCISIGSNITSADNNNLIIGANSTALTNSVTIIGNNTTFVDFFAVGLGGCSVGYGNSLNNSFTNCVGAYNNDTGYSTSIGRGIYHGSTTHNISIGCIGNYSDTSFAITIGHNSSTYSYGGLGSPGAVIGRNATFYGVNCAAIGNNSYITPTNQNNYNVGKDVTMYWNADYVNCIGSRSYSTTSYGISIGADAHNEESGGILVGANTSLSYGCTRSSVIGTGSSLSPYANDSIIIGSGHVYQSSYTLTIGHTAAPASYYQWNFANMPYFYYASDAFTYLTSNDVYVNYGEFYNSNKVVCVV